MKNSDQDFSFIDGIPPVAVLFQSHHPPSIDNIRKPMKPTGYKDSSADIAVALKEIGVKLIIPVTNPDIEKDEDWCFPDSHEGIKKAFDLGARVFWLNTILYSTHPVTNFFDQNIRLIGQHPDCVHQFDDKYLANQLMVKHELPIPREFLLTEQHDGKEDNVIMIPQLSPELLKSKQIEFPLVIKPLRGRGSQGVIKIEDFESLTKNIRSLLTEKITIEEQEYQKYGDRLVLEDYLDGEEITISVLPPGEYFIKGKMIPKDTHWALPIVKRFGHHNGIAPYNGLVAVAENSILLDAELIHDERYKEIVQASQRCGALIDARAPIRIDCRFKGDKAYMFDINMKPNMTGAIRKHRSNQNGLTTIAAKGIDWGYKDLIANILKQAWIAHSKEFAHDH